MQGSNKGGNNAPQDKPQNNRNRNGRRQSRRKNQQNRNNQQAGKNNQGQQNNQNQSNQQSRRQSKLEQKNGQIDPPMVQPKQQIDENTILIESIEDNKIITEEFKSLPLLKSCFHLKKTPHKIYRVSLKICHFNLRFFSLDNGGFRGAGQSKQEEKKVNQQMLSMSFNSHSNQRKKQSRKGEQPTEKSECKSKRDTPDNQTNTTQNLNTKRQHVQGLKKGSNTSSKTSLTIQKLQSQQSTDNNLLTRQAEENKSLGREKSLKQTLETPNTINSESPDQRDSRQEEQMWDFAFDTDSESMESISESDKLQGSCHFV